MDKRFDDSIAQSNARFKYQLWVVGIGFAVTSTLTTLIGLFA